ncbi:short-chain dehydrogenase [Fusarium subglutinans]|uniref:Short-chain dehydrogenase n=1 Tax=Gibberella subglutinans TaxID=42677 RepID=A0A8H5Q3Z9_GIBSU|nr:short-chain dehydrogenase [Fusarium subglutinans]KAF5608247.1 short-chain dehydrogenase [Fusarium subglutinans]
MAAIYANVIAPSSAILLTPTLDWWKVHDAFNAQNFTTLITGNSSRAFPSYLTPRGKCASDPSWDQCPGGGYSTLLSLLRAYQTDGIDLETQIKLPVSKSYRKISSTLDFNEYIAKNESLAVATTSHTSIAMIAGLLWNHILEQKVGKVNDIERPQFRPKIQNIRAPLVQVQCSPFSWINATKKIHDPVFKANNLRNFSQLVDKEGTNHYQRMGSRIAEGKDWHHTKSTLHIPTLRWVDASSLFDDPSLSLAAVATVPAYYFQEDKAKLDSIILPCMIDARWVDVSLEYDPTMDNTINSNFTDLMSLRPYWDPKNTSGPPGGLTSPNVNGTRDVTKIENLMDVFIKTDDDHYEDDDDFIPNHFVPPFNTATGRKLGNFTTDNSKVESYVNEISKTVAAILSLAIVDGMSRNAISLKMRLITKNLQNGSSQGIEEFWEPHPEENGNPGSEIFEATDVDEPVSIDWEVYRYGWGYGRQSTAVYFAITALFIHVVLVLVFGIYMAIFWVSGERPGKSQDTISEFVALALASPLIGDNASEVRRLANGEEEEDRGS